MSREAKVGLLSGLAFIIVFAMILANRGQPQRLATQFPHDLLVARASLTPSDVRGVPSQTPDAGSTTQVAYWWGKSPAATMPDRTDLPAPTSEERIAAVTGAGSNEAPPPTGLTSDIERLLSHPDNRAQFQLVGSDGQPRDSAASPAGPVQRTSVKAELARYVVSKGDTLTSIARKNYGSHATHLVDAIYDSNRDRMSSKHDVRAGVELILPALDGTTLRGGSPPVGDSASPELLQRAADGGSTAGAGVAPGQDSRPAPKDADKDDSSFRWYQVQPKDGYGSIARTQLGDAARWKEIFELNKDIFPDPDRLRAGVRIKIPKKDATSSASRDAKTQAKSGTPAAGKKPSTAPLNAKGRGKAKSDGDSRRVEKPAGRSRSQDGSGGGKSSSAKDDRAPVATADAARPRK